MGQMQRRKRGLREIMAQDGEPVPSHRVARKRLRESVLPLSNLFVLDYVTVVRQGKWDALDRVPIGTSGAFAKTFDN